MDSPKIRINGCHREFAVIPGWRDAISLRRSASHPRILGATVPPAATAPLPPGGGPVPVVLQRSRASWLPRAAHLTHACLRAGRPRTAAAGGPVNGQYGRRTGPNIKKS